MKYLYILSFSFLLLGCKKLDFDKLSKSSLWNPKLAAPLASASFTIGQILDQVDTADILSADNNGLLSFSYKSNFKGYAVSDLVKLPDFPSIPSDTIFDFAFFNQLELDKLNNITGFAAGSKGLRLDKILKIVDPKISFDDQIFPIDFSSSPDLSKDFRIDELVLSSGVIEVELTSQIPHSIDLFCGLNEIKKDGKVLREKISYTPSSSNIKQIDLSGCSAFLSGGNLVFAIDSILIDPVAGNINNNEIILMSVSIKNLVFKSIVGYFGDLKTPTIKDSITLDEFTSTKGSFGITDPSVSLSVSNSFGFPLHFNLDQMYMRRLKTGEKIQLGAVKQALNYPGINEMNSIKKTKILFSPATVSNMDQLITSDPTTFVIGANASVNSGSLPLVTKNFITDSSKIFIDCDINIPLKGYVNNFTFCDTQSFSLPSKIENEVLSIMIRLLANNYLPVNVKSQVIFLDEFNKVVLNSVGDTLKLCDFSSNLLISGPVNAQGFVPKGQSTSTINDFIIKKEDFPFFTKAKKVVFSGFFETFGGKTKSPVTFYDYYGLSIKLAVSTQLNLSGTIKK